MPAAVKGRKGAPPLREMTLAVGDVEFDEIVEILRQVWVVPELPGVKGCHPKKSPSTRTSRRIRRSGRRSASSRP